MFVLDCQGDVQDNILASSNKKSFIIILFDRFDSAGGIDFRTCGRLQIRMCYTRS